ncbi:cell wall glucanase [Malassezia pachydermatis]|uniref:Cell wall glucanase n=1 Tax=Malassezia pachydermatis TaxID=77020 RepID=A0A0M9VN53_9BASI|nr:cell wall glucanase [Malassezia pachydermatis]KOS12993.1 cell wall glucanase [Malassezia pachydermatis]
MDTQIPPSSFNDVNSFRPLLQYNGDANQSPFVFESGYLGQGQEGVLFEMTSAHESRISTSRYMLYGRVTARMRHTTAAGLVSSFRTQSDVGDTIEFRLGGTNVTRISTNFGALDKSPSLLGLDETTKGFNVNEFHNYTIDWTPSNVSWAVDNQIIRTLQRQNAGNMFPRSPSRVVFALYGTSSGSSKQEKDWANGILSYQDKGYQDRGYFAQELSHVTINCPDLKLSNVSLTGVGAQPVAYYYTGKYSQSSQEPEFALSRDNIQLLPNPTQDGKPGIPGYPGASPQGPKPNMFTGGAGRQSTPTNTTAPSSGVSNGIKIGIPVAIGGAIVLGILGIALFYLYRKKKAQKTKAEWQRQQLQQQQQQSLSSRPVSSYAPSTMPTQAAPAMITYPSAPVSQNVAYAAPSSLSPPAAHDMYAQTPIIMPAVAYSTQDTGDTSMALSDKHSEASDTYVTEGPSESSKALVRTTSQDDMDERAYYYQDPYAPEPSYDVDSDAHSDSREHMHYAGHGAMSRFHPYLSPEENEQLAAQDAWDELRYAALGDDDSSYFQSRSEGRSLARHEADVLVSHPSTRARSHRHRAQHRAAYSQGGALSPPTHTHSHALVESRRTTFDPAEGFD